MITTVMAAGLVLAACGNGDDAADDGTTAIPESGSDEGTDDDSDDALTSDDPATGDAMTDDALIGTSWTVVEGNVQGASVAPNGDASANVEFAADGKVGGYTGCNSFGGTAEASDGKVTFSDVISTQRACTGNAGDLEKAMLTMLGTDVSYEIDGDTVTFTNANDDTLVFEAS
jgi:putative lipoprotein